MMGLILLFHGRPVPASWLVFIAVFFDFMDGRIARRLGGGSQFGLEFDSLADVVSFGVVPAMIMYTEYASTLGVAGVLAASFLLSAEPFVSHDSTWYTCPVPSRVSPFLPEGSSLPQSYLQEYRFTLSRRLFSAWQQAPS